MYFVFQMRVKLSKHNPPVGAAIVAKAVSKAIDLSVEWTAKETSCDVGEGVILTNSASIIRYVIKCCNKLMLLRDPPFRYLVRSAPKLGLYSEGVLPKTQVDHWLSFSTGPLTCGGDQLEKAMAYLDSVVSPKAFLVENSKSAADFAVFGALFANKTWQTIQGLKNVPEWFKFIGNVNEVKEGLSGLPKDLTFVNPVVDKKKPDAPRGGVGGSGGKKSDQPKQTKDEGKFVDLPGAEMGKVIVRFPPEASG